MTKRVALTVNPTQGVVRFHNQTIPFESFLRNYKLLIDYVVFKQYIGGSLKVFFYAPLTNKKWARAQPNWLNQADIHLATPFKIYMK